MFICVYSKQNSAEAAEDVAKNLLQEMSQATREGLYNYVYIYICVYIYIYMHIQVICLRVPDALKATV